jgi:hypothetical protein
MADGQFWPPIQGNAWANLGAEQSNAEGDPVSRPEDREPAGRAEGEAGRRDPEGTSPEVTRRVSSILDAVEREAESIRERAKQDARRYTEYSRRRADGLVAERQRLIAALSDQLVARAERVLKGLDDVEPVRAAFERLVNSLGEMAERLDREAGDYSEFVPPTFEGSRPDPAPTPPSPGSAWPPGPPGPGAPQPSDPTPPPASGKPWPPGPESPPPRPEQDAGTPGAAPDRPTGLAAQDWRSLERAQVVAIQMAAEGSTRGEVEVHLRHSLGVADPRTVLDEVFGAGSAADAHVPWARPAR